MKTKILKEEAKKESEDDETEIEEDEESVATAVLDEWIEDQSMFTQEELNQAYSRTDKTPRKKFKEYTSFKEMIIDFIEYLILNVFPEWYHRKWQEKRLPALVQMGMKKSVKEMLDKKLEQKLLVAETIVKPEKEQGRYFFDNLQKLRLVRQGLLPGAETPKRFSSNAKKSSDSSRTSEVKTRSAPQIEEVKSSKSKKSSWFGSSKKKSSKDDIGEIEVRSAPGVTVSTKNFSSIYLSTKILCPSSLSFKGSSLSQSTILSAPGKAKGMNQDGAYDRLKNAAFLL